MINILIFFGIIILATLLVGKLKDLKVGKEINPSVYERKPYIFDTSTELNFYKSLLELYADKYHIFVQVNYSHLIQPKKNSYEIERRYRNSIDRKSADFVLCSKDSVIPVLVIELDGFVHNFKKRKARDEFINSVANVSDLPLLHIKTTEMDKDNIKKKIDFVLSKR